jgi:hypothetical protein
MLLYAVMTPTDHAGLQAALNTHFPDNYLKVGTGQYIVAAKTTVVEVSNILGISNAINGTGIVVGISGYFGRTSQNIWEWMAAKGSTV